MGDFRFAQCLEFLRSKNVADWKDLGTANPDHREILLSRIGMIVRQGSSNERRLVRHAVRMFSLGHKLEGQREDIQVDLSRFTSLLKEYGDHNGESPKYTHQTVSVEPPLFKYSVSLKGVRGEGTGRTMKMAKHQASKDACQRLDLKVH